MSHKHATDIINEMSHQMIIMITELNVTSFSTFNGKHGDFTFYGSYI